MCFVYIKFSNNHKIKIINRFVEIYKQHNAVDKEEKKLITQLEELIID
jgi:hypothetical protein